MSYKKIISECVVLIETSDFWKQAEVYRASSQKRPFSVDALSELGRLERELVERLNKVDEKACQISLGLFYVVRDGDSQRITEAMIDQKIKDVPSPCGESKWICWDQLLGKFTCVKTLTKGLTLMAD